MLTNIKDKLIVLKLHIFAYLAKIMQLHLTYYQGDWWMVPFMNEDIQKVTKSFLQVLVKPKTWPIKQRVTGWTTFVPKRHTYYAEEDQICKLLAVKHIDEVLVN